MEASEQQRRLESQASVGRFAGILGESQLEYDGIDLADMVWLAQFMPLGASLGEPSTLIADQEPGSDRPSDHSLERDATPSPPPEPSLPITAPPPQRETSTNPPQDSSPQNTPNSPPPGMPFAVPAAPALRTRLDLARALRPLMRKVPSPIAFDLDEVATVTHIAETEVWSPVQQARPERWLELDLVIEDSKTTAIWERTIAELKHLVEYQGAFRAVRTWRLTTRSRRDDDDYPGDERSGDERPEDDCPMPLPVLLPGWHEGDRAGATQPRPHSPRELIDPQGRRLVWVVSDCVSSLWRSPTLKTPGGIYDLLSGWGRSQPVAIVQMFPPWLWPRTALHRGHTVRFGALIPGMANAHLEVRGLPRRLLRRPSSALVHVPILTLDPESLQTWVRMISGSGAVTAAGRTFDCVSDDALARSRRSAQGAPDSPTETDAENRPAPETAPEIPPETLTPRERVDRFRASVTTPTVLKLATLMAATPVSLPVIDLLCNEFAGEFPEPVAPHHVAEVLLSGLLRRCDDPDERMCRYEFWGDEADFAGDGVREILLGGASIATTERVLNVLSAAICRKLGYSTAKSFAALLGELQVEDGELRAIALPFARVGLRVLRRLGGDYAAIADHYDPGHAGTVTVRPQPGVTLEDIEYEVAVFEPETELETDWPPLVEFEYEPVEAIALLQRFEFETAPLTGSGTATIIPRRFASNWGYTEALSDAVGLDMMRIPGGTFQMGAPNGEPEALDREKPQHKVSVSQFFMGRYPITQAQWRVVASYPRVERDLDSNPSNFQGNENRPVERVSWDDAQEFCRRLSQRTGRVYRLPSEAEWEYACRAGTQTPFHFGEILTTEVANYDENYRYNDSPKGKYRQQTTEVGQFPANEWGLHDMHGNVWEWCEDDWHSNYEGAPLDGSAWFKENRTEIGKMSSDAQEKENRTEIKLLRGGSWLNAPRICRAASRYYYSRVGRRFNCGFRVVCVAPSAL